MHRNGDWAWHKQNKHVCGLTNETCVLVYLLLKREAKVNQQPRWPVMRPLEATSSPDHLNVTGIGNSYYGHIGRLNRFYLTLIDLEVFVLVLLTKF